MSLASSLSNGVSPALQDTIAARKADWRVGHLLYQVFVDRFAPSRRLDTKRHHYAAPRRLRAWTDVPTHGQYLADECIHENEISFWGGDLESLRERLDHIQSLGVDVVYLNPVFAAFSNHKYDADNFYEVDPQYGTNEELKALCDDIHRRGMKLMLDGVFNHMGRRSPLFLRAFESQNAEERGWFYFGPEYKNGYRTWRNGANLPELNLECAAVRDWIWEKENSVVQYWIREMGIDGWRLDCAPDIGFQYLAELTDAAHRARPDACIIGEAWSYPEEWLRVMDGVMNMHVRTLILSLVDGKIAPTAMGRALDAMARDCGIEGLLRSHLVLDNHDVPRLATVVPDRARRRLAQVLQMTLPGCPVIYYGHEVGMEGGNDPTNRAPMRWDLVSETNEETKFLRRLIDMRAAHPALRYGEFRVLECNRLLAFQRYTDRALDTMIVLVNPTDEPVHDTIPVRNSRLMDSGPVECVLTGERLMMHCGLADASLPPMSAHVYQVRDWPHPGGYSLYKRVP
jgi:glycosidase